MPDARNRSTTEGDAPGGIVASILTLFTYLKGAAEMIGVVLKTAGQYRAIKSLLINLLQAENTALEFLLELFKNRALGLRLQTSVNR
jgi:hypothetical protein